MLVLLVEDNGKGFIYDKTKREGIGDWIISIAGWKPFMGEFNWNQASKWNTCNDQNTNGKQ